MDYLRIINKKKNWTDYVRLILSAANLSYKNWIELFHGVNYDLHNKFRFIAIYVRRPIHIIILPYMQNILCDKLEQSQNIRVVWPSIWKIDITALGTYFQFNRKRQREKYPHQK